MLSLRNIWILALMEALRAHAKHRASAETTLPAIFSRRYYTEFFCVISARKVFRHFKCASSCTYPFLCLLARSIGPTAFRRPTDKDLEVTYPSDGGKPSGCTQVCPGIILVISETLR